MSNFNIKIGESNAGNGDENSACLLNGKVAQGATKNFECYPRQQGRYLFIQSNLDIPLSLCEVKVFGEYR